LFRYNAGSANCRVWRPEAAWLKGFQKVQLAHLIGEIRGPAYRTAAERKKKSELVESLDKLFADAAEGRMEDKSLAEKLNAWLPANLREPAEATKAAQEKSRITESSFLEAGASCVQAHGALAFEDGFLNASTRSNPSLESVTYTAKNRRHAPLIWGVRSPLVAGVSGSHQSCTFAWPLTTKTPQISWRSLYLLALPC
jgi:hypothetical protein